MEKKLTVKELLNYTDGKVLVQVMTSGSKILYKDRQEFLVHSSDNYYDELCSKIIESFDIRTYESESGTRLGMIVLYLEDELKMKKPEDKYDIKEDLDKLNKVIDESIDPSVDIQADTNKKIVKPVIDLRDQFTVNLIIKCESGIMYSNTTGGERCHHPKVEGVLLPLRSDIIYILDEFDDFSSDDFNYKKFPNKAKNKEEMEEIYNRMLDSIEKEIQKFLYSAKTGYHVFIDRDVKKHEEAWFHLIFKGGAVKKDKKHITIFDRLGLDEFKAVLTYPNSD